MISPRNQPIRKITPHIFAGTTSIENVGNGFMNPERRASYNYGIGSDGRVAMYVEERNRSLASSSSNNDNQAVTIGIQNSSTGGHWPVSDRALEAFVELSVDICKRNGIDQLVYDGTPNGTVTRHNFFSNTTCPGLFIQNRLPELTAEINKRIKESEMTQETQEMFNQMMNEYLRELGELPESDWSKTEGSWKSVTDASIFNGKRPQGFMTREETAAVLFRLGLIDIFEAEEQS
jgi:hypothetical protein